MPVGIIARLHRRFRAEMFDLPNHMSYFTVANQLGAPQANGTYQGGNFGQVTAATDPRSMKFVLRVYF